MLSQIRLLLAVALLVAQLTAVRSINQTGSGVLQHNAAKVETIYDADKDKTTVRLSPLKIAGEQGKYVSLKMSPSFSSPGRQVVTPSIIDFELQTVVRGRLRTDLYVLFIVNGEKIFLSSSRWAIKRPVPGRVWMGERLVFRMPYETYVKITKANSFEIKFDALTFPLGEDEKQALCDFLTYMKPGTTGDKSRDAVIAPGLFARRLRWAPRPFFFVNLSNNARNNAGLPQSKRSASAFH